MDPTVQTRNDHLEPRTGNLSEELHGAPVFDSVIASDGPTLHPLFDQLRPPSLFWGHLANPFRRGCWPVQPWG